MKKSGQKHELVPTASRRKLSRPELARFLSRLAGLYSSDEYGNLALAEALRVLAEEVRESGRGERKEAKANVKTREPLTAARLNEFRSLSSESVAQFISDEQRTKDELLALASSRFSMPVSQLRRMKLSEVRNAVKSALLHEHSIEILSEEAGRDGSNRKS